jgi:hypothetical protein
MITFSLSLYPSSEIIITDGSDTFTFCPPFDGFPSSSTIDAFMKGNRNELTFFFIDSNDTLCFSRLGKNRFFLRFETPMLHFEKFVEIDDTIFNNFLREILQRVEKSEKELNALWEEKKKDMETQRIHENERRRKELFDRAEQLRLSRE